MVSFVINSWIDIDLIRRTELVVDVDVDIKIKMMISAN